MIGFIVVSDSRSVASGEDHGQAIGDIGEAFAVTATENVFSLGILTDESYARSVYEVHGACIMYGNSVNGCVACVKFVAVAVKRNSSCRNLVHFFKRPLMISDKFKEVVLDFVVRQDLFVEEYQPGKLIRHQVQGTGSHVAFAVVEHTGGVQAGIPPFFFQPEFCEFIKIHQKSSLHHGILPEQ